MRGACPCTSGRPYAGCCEPLHRGVREADTPEALMRSRFSAFALRDADYLARTLHPDHEDRALPQADLVRRIKASASAFKYMALEILDRRDPGEDGIAQVLFLARVFEKGKERSFVELSDFAHDGEGWRYLRGVALPVARVHGDPMALTVAAFPTLEDA
jgi:SEC-C motif-containing protein